MLAIFSCSLKKTRVILAVSGLIACLAAPVAFSNSVDTNLTEDEKAQQALEMECELNYSWVCPAVFSPAMCVFQGSGKWFGESHRCKAEGNLKLWACKNGYDPEELEITCYRAVLDASQ